MTYHHGLSTTPRDSFYEQLNKRTPVGVDTETVSISNRTLLGIGVAFSQTEAYYVTPNSHEFDAVLGVLRDKSRRKIYHNAPFDLRVLRKYDVDIDEVDDTALMARLKPEDSAVLEDVSFWLHPFGHHQTQTVSHLMAQYKVRKFTDLPADVIAEKCCKDAKAAYGLFFKYKDEISMSYYEGLRVLIGPLERISRQGIRLDQDVLQILYDDYSFESTCLHALFRRMGFNINSRYELGYTLSERGNALPFLPKSGLLATDEDNLIRLDDPLVWPILRCRDIDKKLSTYIKPWLGKERAYTTLRMEAATGRLNSSNAGELEDDRNLQNIPKVADSGSKHHIRSAFIPDNGVFTFADKSQLELRILAYRSGDEYMLNVFKNDGDLHEDTSKRMNLPRVRAKNLNFGIPYGADVAAVMKVINKDTAQIIRDPSIVAEQIELWYRTYPQAAQYFTDQEQFGLDNGYVMTTGGRKMRIPWELGEKHGRNCCRNYPIQGTAAEDVFALMRWVVQETSWLEVTRLQIHDELMHDGLVEYPDMVLNETKTAKEGYKVYDVKGELAYLTSDYYLPIEVSVKERWG